MVASTMLDKSGKTSDCKASFNSDFDIARAIALNSLTNFTIESRRHH